MKLLYDQNLSPRLVDLLDHEFPNSSHIHQIGLGKSSDEEIWTYASENEFTIVTKDSDFGDLSILRGYPPKLVWVRLGNCTTLQIEELLKSNHEHIQQLVNDPDIGILSLF
jgi:predicted nuclease of predicted toxin-antitoxin system